MLTDTLLRLFEISIATSFLILPLCLASRRINRRYGAKWKYYIWLLLAVRLMIPVNLPAVNGFSILPDLSQRQQIHTQEQPIQSQAHTGSQPETVPSQSQEQEQPISEPPYSIDGTKENTEAQPAAIMNVTDIAAIVWCVGFCVFSVFQLYVYYAFRRGIFVDGRECENNSIHELVVSTSHAIGLRQTMPVIISRKVNSPMILGIFRPVLVIPREDYSSAELNMIVRHELTHCKRHDIAFKMLLKAVNALHWFNPFVYLMVREANADIELCCDADVLRNADTVQRKAYAESILTSMEREKGFVPVFTCFSNGGINTMKERLENIVDNGKRRSGIVLLAVTIVMSVLLGAFVSCGSDVHSQDDAIVSDSSAKDSDNIMPIVKTAGLELVDIEKIPDMPYPAEGDYLTLHEALYAINYAKSRIYADTMKLPKEERAESVYLYTYSVCKAAECGYFGSGTPCKEWTENHWHLPFHSTDEEFMKSSKRPAWVVTVKPHSSEVENDTEMIWIDAQTGDMYNDTNSGGYYPSPYLDRSEYARILHDEEMKKSATSTTITDAAQKPTVASSVNKEISDQELVTIRDYIPNIYIDVKYATTDNFTGQVIYDFSEPSLRYGTIKKLMKVQKELNKRGYSLKVWDAYRPIEAQLKLWEICPDPAYVSDPNKGYSGHCRGNTIDVTLVTADGKELEMPSGYDEFSALADRDYSDVSSAAAKNAELLESVMKKHDFKGYQAEWWHYTDTVSYRVVK